MRLGAFFLGGGLGFDFGGGIFLTSPLGFKSFLPIVIAEVADIGLGVRQVGTVSPETNDAHHRGATLFELFGSERPGVHGGLSISERRRRVGNCSFPPLL